MNSRSLAAEAMEARAPALPPDYRVVYGEMKSYMWRFTSGDGWVHARVRMRSSGLRFS